MKETYFDRLILRPFRETDYEDLYEFLSQLRCDVFEPHPNIDHETSRQRLIQRLGSEEFYAIELKNAQNVIGNIYCASRDFGAKEVGYIVNENYRREGYGREALKAVVDFAFNDGVHRVYAECDPRNEPSWNLLEKNGLEREAHFKQNIYFFTDESGHPQWKDTYVYAITADRWRARSI